MPQAGEVVAFRTGQLYEMQMVEQALEAAGIPSYRLLDELGIGEIAMPAIPAMGPGVEFLVIISEQDSRRAHQVIQRLPFASHPEEGVWAFRPTNRAQKIFKIYALIMLTMIAGYFLFALIEFSLNLFR